MQGRVFIRFTLFFFMFFFFNKFKFVSDWVGARLRVGFYLVWDAFDLYPNRLDRLRQWDKGVQITGKNAFVKSFIIT